MYTNSRDWFATSYNSFHSVINEISDFVLPFNKLVKGKTIVNRKTIELPNNELGLYVNTYASFEDGQVGNDTINVAINYLEHDVTFNFNGKDYNVPALQAMQLS